MNPTALIDNNFVGPSLSRWYISWEFHAWFGNLFCVSTLLRTEISQMLFFATRVCIRRFPQISGDVDGWMTRQDGLPVPDYANLNATPLPVGLVFSG